MSVKLSLYGEIELHNLLPFTRTNLVMMQDVQLISILVGSAHLLLNSPELILASRVLQGILLPVNDRRPLNVAFPEIGLATAYVPFLLFVLYFAELKESGFNNGIPAGPKPVSVVDTEQVMELIGPRGESVIHTFVKEIQIHTPFSCNLLVI